MPKTSSQRQVDEQRWRAFAEEYIKTFDQSKAYVDCGYFKSTTKNSVNACASRLMTNPDVKRYINEAIDDRKKRLNMKDDLVVVEQFRLATSDIRNYLQWNETGIHVKPSSELTEDESRAISSIEMVENYDNEGSIRSRRFKFQMHNKNVALEQLSKHFGMYRERVDHVHTFGTIKVPAQSNSDNWESVVAEQIEHVNGSSTSAGHMGSE